MATDPPEHFTFEEGAGLVRVHLLRSDDGAITGARVAAPRSLSIGDDVPVELAAACASLRPNDIATRAHTPLIASVGTDFVIAEVVSADALARAAPDLAAFRDAAAQFPDAGRPVRACTSTPGSARKAGVCAPACLVR